MAPVFRQRLRRRRLLAGFFVSLYCRDAEYSNYSHVAASVVVVVAADDDELTSSYGYNGDGSRSRAALHNNNAVMHEMEAKTKRSVESVISAIVGNLENSKIGGNTESNENNDRIRRKKRNQRQRKQTSLHKEQQNNNSMDETKPRNLIIGGSIAPPGRFPYAVSLQLEKILDEASSAAYGDYADVEDYATCGGTLIAMDVVLTAAHCGYEQHQTTTSTSSTTINQDSQGVNFGQTPQQVFVGADVGAYNLTDNNGGGYTVENMLFEKLVLHPDYTGFQQSGSGIVSLQHDVMLVKLYGASDQPVVRLHNPHLDKSSGDDENSAHRTPEAGEELVVIGWGDTDPEFGDEHTTISSVIHAASLTYVPNDVCEESKGYSVTQSYTSTEAERYSEYAGSITEDMMCAIGQYQQDACQGDSGGALIRLGDDFTGDVQMGIVSWGMECGDKDFPGVYSRVGAHYDWIESMVCELSDSPPTYFNCAPKPYPPGSPYDPVVELTITVQFDAYVAETGWVLESIPDFRNIAFRPFGTYYEGMTSIDENNTVSEVVSVLAGRFYMLSMLDEFGDGFCCKVGSGYFRVDSSSDENPVVSTTFGILWSSYALRRAFYVSRPDNSNPPDFITVVVTLGMGADPSQLLLVVVENVKFEALLLYNIQPFNTVSDSRIGTETAVDSLTFRVPVFGEEFNRQRYNVIVYDDNYDGAYKASFEVYLGDVGKNNLILAQSGDYGYNNFISRSFVLFEEQGDGTGSSLPKSSGAARKQNFDIKFYILLCLLTSLGILFS